MHKIAKVMKEFDETYFNLGLEEKNETEEEKLKAISLYLNILGWFIFLTLTRSNPQINHWSFIAPLILSILLIVAGLVLGVMSLSQKKIQNLFRWVQSKVYIYNMIGAIIVLILSIIGVYTNIGAFLAAIKGELTLEAVILVALIGALVTYFWYLRKSMRFGIFSTNLTRRKLRALEGTRLAGNLLIGVMVLVFFIICVFALEGAGDNDSSAWQTTASMVGGAVIGILLGASSGNAMRANQLETALQEGKDHLRLIEFSSSAYTRATYPAIWTPSFCQNKDIRQTETDLSTVDLINSVEKYLKWSTSFHHGHNRGLPADADYRVVEIFRIFLERIMDQNSENKSKPPHSKLVAKKFLGENISTRSQARKISLFSRGLRERLEEIS